MDNLLAYEVRLQEHDVQIAACEEVAWQYPVHAVPAWRVALARMLMRLALRLAASPESLRPLWGSQSN